MTKELLSEVLQVNVYWIGDGTPENKISYSSDNEASITKRSGYCINTYELMHLMKIWAAKRNFKVVSELSYGTERGRARLEQYQEFDMYDVFGYKIGRTSKSDWFEEKSEPDAVCEACQWILENIK